VHIPVLAAEALTWLNVRENGVYLDCTAGAGGHSALIAERLTTGRLLALDRDAAAVQIASDRLAEFATAQVMHSNHGRLREALTEAGIDLVDGVLLDAGLSSMQLDTPSRGFSFQQEGPLDMRMDTHQGVTAAEYLAAVSETELTRVLKEYGDVGPARRIASAVIRRRDKGLMNTTPDLAQAVAEALPFVTGVPEETRTVFQAVRIAVNEELRWLDEGVRQALDVLKPGGRFVGISFHSGEDRIIKNVLRTASRPQRELHPDGRVKRTVAPLVRVLTPKPVEPGDTESRRNPRARSARMRVAERLDVVLREG
jgi:16S rRNA (cytosine1402-N4)-methyltransferase